MNFWNYNICHVFKEKEEASSLHHSFKQNKALPFTDWLQTCSFIWSQITWKKFTCFLLIIVIPIGLLCLNFWYCVHLKNDKDTRDQIILILSDEMQVNISSSVNDTMNHSIIFNSICYAYLLAITLMSNVLLICYKHRNICEHYMSEQGKEKPIRLMEVIWLLSAFGYYILVFFTLMAIAALKQKHSRSDIPFMVDVKLVGTISQGVQIALQVVFFFRVLRNDDLTKSSVDGNNYNSESGNDQRKDNCVSHVALKMTLFTLFIFNLGFWLICSIVEIDNLDLFAFYKMEHYKEAYWTVIGHLTYPLALYFRFYSAMNFLIFFKML